MVVFLQAVVEQLSYGPTACASFFFGMSILEGKTIDDALLEVKTKFIPTYKVNTQVTCFTVEPLIE